MTAILPVAYDATRAALLACFEAESPDVWLGLGVSAARPRIELEALAVNVEHTTRPDNRGASPVERPVVPGAPLAWRTRLDVHGHVARLAARGYPVGVSFHAGTFLCNQAFYLGCHACETTGTPALAAFVHVPMPDAVPIDVTTATVIALLDGLTEP